MYDIFSKQEPLVIIKRRAFLSEQPFFHYVISVYRLFCNAFKPFNHAKHNSHRYETYYSKY